MGLQSYSGASVDVVHGTSIHGRRLALGSHDEPVCKGIPWVEVAADAVVTVGANQAAGGTIQLNHPDGTAIAHPQNFSLYVVSLTTGQISSLATTGGSTGIAIGASGFIAQTKVSKKIFDCFTNNVGLFAFTWTDNASEVAFLAVELPNGRLVISAQLPTS